MKGKLFLPVLILALLVQAIGCAPAAMQRAPAVMPTPAPEFPVPAPAVVDEVVTEYEKGAPGMPVPPAEERLIVKTGNISLLVENTEESLTRIEALASELGGFVTNSNSWRVN